MQIYLDLIEFKGRGQRAAQAITDEVIRLLFVIGGGVPELPFPDHLGSWLEPGEDAAACYKTYRTSRNLIKI